MQQPALSMATAVLCVSAAMGQAHAQAQKMRPGLWEHTVAIKSQSGQMEAAMAQMKKSMASLPPEQRKQIEQAMAQQSVGIGPQGNTVKMCISPEQADLDNIPPQEGCTQNVKRTGPNTLAMTFTCKGGPGQPPTSGEGTMTFSGPTAYVGTFKVKTTTAGGQPEQIDMSQAGKWLSADCGTIKSVR